MALVPFPRSQTKSSRASTAFDGLLGNVSILELLEQFRRLMVHSSLAVAVGVLIGFVFINRIVDFILGPTRRSLPSGTTLIYTQPGEAFGLYIQIALIVGVVFAMPFVMYRLWRFVGPIMPAGARRFAAPFVLFTTLGFLAGAAFVHYIAFPYMMVFFASFNTPDLAFMPKLADVFDLYTKMLLGMGVVFQMPTAVFFLSKAGLVSARWLWRSFRYAILLIFIAAAVITPTGDMVTQTIFASPMIGLYLLSILIAWMFGRVRPAPPDGPESENG
jgi:sec-independent protein translocase protein TatC